MATLHVHLSNFRVSHSSQSNITPVQILLRSAQVHIKPLESPAGVVSDDGHAVNFPNWKSRWEEQPPQANSYLHLFLRSVDLRSKWRRLRSYVLNPFRNSSNKVSHILAQTKLNLATLATSTVRRCVRVPTNLRDGSYYDVSFDAVVEERRDIRILLNLVSVHCPAPLRSAYLVVAVNGRHVLAPERFVHVASPTFDDVPPVILPRCSLAKLARANITIRVHEAEHGNRCVGEIAIPMHDVWSSAIRSGHASSFQGKLLPRVQDIELSSNNNNTNNDDDDDDDGGSDDGEREENAEDDDDENFVLDDADSNDNSVGTIEGSVVLHNVPSTGQMAEGVTTHEGMTGGRPIFCGAVLPAGDIVRSNQDILRLPHNWVELFDTFGYRFYHNIGTAQNAWLCPSDGLNATEHDALLATLGFEKTDNNLFRSLVTGAESWVHPAAERIPAVSSSMSGDTESEVSSIRYGFTPNSTPGSRRHISMSSRTVSSFSLPRAPSVPFPEELTLSELPAVQQNGSNASDATNVPEPSSSNSLALDEEAPRMRYSREKYLTEMKWIRLRERGDNQIIPGPSTEAHSLTTVQSGKTVLKFGGKSNAGKSNEVFAYDADSMNWSTLHPLGAPPAPRFGHSAVALGSDKSRMLVFGGSTAQGRMNDLHILHMDNLAWSPVYASGTPPEARARMGMCVTDSGDLAMLFGGRTVYRFLGGKYFDSEYVNVFHAARSQWVQMTPRGPGPRPAPRSGCAVEFVNERCMFVHGGYDDGDEYYSDSWLFDLSTSTWQQTPYPGEPTEPKARESHASTVLNGDVLVYGGELERGGYSSSLSVFDTSKLRWTAERPKGNTPPGLVGAKMATVNDNSVLLAGGDSGFSMCREAFVLDIERFDRTELDTLKERARSRDIENEICSVCLDANVQAMFVWCGHTVCCNRCARKLNSCPICRRPVGTILQLSSR